jgi:hypothetical protein
MISATTHAMHLRRERGRERPHQWLREGRRSSKERGWRADTPTPTARSTRCTPRRGLKVVCRFDREALRWGLGGSPYSQAAHGVRALRVSRRRQRLRCSS